MRLLTLACFSLIFALAADAQTTGTIVGKIADQSGAVVIGAEVVATNDKYIEIRSPQGTYRVVLP